MKKILLFLLCLVLCFAVVSGCGNDKDNTTNPDDGQHIESPNKDDNQGDNGDESKIVSPIQNGGNYNF